MAEAWANHFGHGRVEASSAGSYPFGSIVKETYVVMGEKGITLDGQCSKGLRDVALEDMDVLVIQHQPGLITWQALADLLGDPRLAGRHIIVTLHSVRWLFDARKEDRLQFIAALRNISRVLVHTAADLNLLKGLNLIDNVTLLPHGSMQGAEIRPPRNLPRGSAPLIGCYGFFLPGKGIPLLIESIALLRRQWPAVRLRLVNAEYPVLASSKEIEMCRTLAAKLGIDDAIEWHTEFLPQEGSNRLLSECDLVVLPYYESKESASGAVRVALASGAPVATTPIGLFEELGDAVLKLPNSDVQEFADGLRSLLMDVETRRGLQKAASIWLDEHDWSRIARRLNGILSGLHATAPRKRPVSAAAEKVGKT